MEIVYEQGPGIVVLTMPGVEQRDVETVPVAPFVYVSHDRHGRLARVTIFRFRQRRWLTP